MERIDVHAHAVPPKYRQYMLDNGFDQPDGMASIPVRNQFLLLLELGLLDR